MTTTDPHALGRRWLAASGPWLPGMLVCGASPAFRRIELHRERPSDRKAWPDLTDPATLGAAIGHLETLLGCEIEVERVWGGWCVRRILVGDVPAPGALTHVPVASGPTKAEAVVAALEAHRADR